MCVYTHILYVCVCTYITLRIQATYCRDALWVVAAHGQAELSWSVALWLSSSPPSTPHNLHQGDFRFTMTKAAVLVAANSVQIFYDLFLTAFLCMAYISVPSAASPVVQFWQVFLISLSKGNTKLKLSRKPFIKASLYSVQTCDSLPSLDSNLEDASTEQS